MDYLNIYKKLVTLEGVAIENIDPFIKRHFTTTSNTNYIEAINNGVVISVCISSNIENSGHAIAVVGYRKQYNELNLIYMDPATRKLEVISYAEFNPYIAISITGIKNITQ